MISLDITNGNLGFIFLNFLFDSQFGMCCWMVLASIGALVVIFLDACYELYFLSHVVIPDIMNWF